MNLGMVAQAYNLRLRNWRQEDQKVQVFLTTVSWKLVEMGRLVENTGGSELRDSSTHGHWHL